MLYRTIENTAHVRLRRKRHCVLQRNEFPLEDLHGNIIVNERRVTPDRKTEGVEVTETKMSQAEFQEYFDKSKR